MKISIYNFKSIGSLVEYEIHPLDILSGTNSSGKSSFIQLLLLLKQTIEIDSGQHSLVLNGELFPVRNYLDILKGKTLNNTLKIALTFDKSELNEYRNFHEIGFYEAIGYSTLTVSIEFNIANNKVFVSKFEVKFILPEIEKSEQYIRFINNSNSFTVDTNTAVFNKKLFFENGKYIINKINYSSIFPVNYEIELNGTAFKEVPQLEGIKAIVSNFFTRLNYIGPLREQPKDEYKYTGNDTTVGVKGEYVAEVLEKYSNELIEYVILKEEEELKFEVKKELFLTAVRYWLCKKFNLCVDIYSKREVDSYSIYVKSQTEIESTIKHVGFGISQILPIIVEGLRLPIGETLILEQPEIHLHPKIQSQLFDFLIAIVQQGKKVIIETHSDHLITRLRRRIAEDQTNSLKDKIRLTFIETAPNDVLFRNIEIDDFGGLDYFPDDFIEKADVELKAILRAQMKKRLTKQIS